MATPNPKRLREQILGLSKNKPAIIQPGRVVAHIINELTLGSDSTARTPVTKALLALRDEGKIKLEMAGNVINAMYYVTPPGETVVASPTVTKLPASRPRTRRTATVRPTLVVPEPSPIAPQESSDPVIEVVSPTQQLPAVLTKKSLYERLVERVEEVNLELAVSRTADAALNSVNLQLEQEIRQLNEQLREKDSALAQANADKARLAEELELAGAALEESSETLSDLTSQNQALQAQLDEFAELEERALKALQ
ncbi:MAG: hypothetical protein ACOH18_02905 [Candidatus Saccharimonadaceae bacterium]